MSGYREITVPTSETSRVQRPAGSTPTRTHDEDLGLTVLIGLRLHPVVEPVRAPELVRVLLARGLSPKTGRIYAVVLPVICCSYLMPLDRSLLTNWLCSPKILEAGRRQLCVPDRVLNVLVARSKQQAVSRWPRGCAGGVSGALAVVVGGL